jgi:ABC-type transport system involved in multi-copper enzyme maturation permease subunit
MSFLPVVERELRAAARRRGTFWTRVFFALIAVAVAVVVVPYVAAFKGRSSGTGGMLLIYLTVLAFGFCALAGVFLTADSLSEEKREGTLGLLFLTDLKGYDVVMGKLMATSLSAFYGLLAVFPVLAIPLTMGGVTHGEFWRLVLVFVNTLFFSLTAGLFVSSLSRRADRAMGGTFWLVLLVAGGLPLFEWILAWPGWVSPLTISLPSPLTACRLAFDSGTGLEPRGFWQSLLSTQLLSWLLLILASVLLPRLWQEGVKVSWTMTREATLDETAFSRRRAERGQMLDENPVYWLSSRKQSVIWNICFGCLLAVGAAWFGFHFDKTLASEGLMLGAGAVSLLVKLSVGVQACRFFVEARRTGSLELLLCTPLTAHQILRGQWLALRRLFLVPVLSVLCLYALPIIFALATDSRSYLWPRLGIGGAWFFRMATFVADLLAVAWLGMWVGLRTKKLNLAPGLALVYGAALPLVSLCVCAPGLLIDIPVIFWAREKLYRELRSVLSQRYRPAVEPLYGRDTRVSAAVPPVIRS